MTDQDWSVALEAWSSAFAHHTRSTLGVIKGYLQMLHSGILGPLSAEQADIVGRMVPLPSRILRMIDQLRAFALLQADGDAIALAPAAPADLGSLVAREVVAYQEEASLRHVRLEVRLPQITVDVAVDSDRFSHIIGNLIHNALLVSESGSPVTVSVTGDAQWAFVAVQDRGPGISPEDRVRIFEPFERGIRNGPSATGVGLGLPIARCLARACGGDVEAAGVPGEGAVFTLRLPA